MLVRITVTAILGVEGGPAIVRSTVNNFATSAALAEVCALLSAILVRYCMKNEFFTRKKNKKYTRGGQEAELQMPMGLLERVISDGR